MLPTEERIKELQERFGVHNGRFFGEYRFKNLNWYLSSDDAHMTTDKDEWFCYGDIREVEVMVLPTLLHPGEALVLGWKEMGPNQKFDDIFRYGGGVWLLIKPEGVLFDVRRDMERGYTCQNPECPAGGRCHGLCSHLFGVRPHAAPQG